MERGIPVAGSPLRLSAVDVARLTPVEAYAILVHLAGHEDPVVAGAAVEAARKVLARTRG